MKKALLLLTALTLALTLSAAERSKVVMMKLAKQHMSLQNKDDVGEVKLVAERPTMAIYSDGKQFTVISRDDSYDAVLAYGAGEFNVDSAPANVKWWMAAVEEALAKGATQRRASLYTAVAPLMTTKWGQDEPYNNLAPEVKDEDKKTVNAPCGCIATAMGQVLNYCAYPASVDFKGSYTIDGSEDATKEQVTETFSWPYKLAYGAYLPDGYKSSKDAEYISYTDDEGDAVARLIRACGLAVNMDYSYEGSGAASYYSALAFVEKFKYPEQSVKWLSRLYYNTDDWLDMLHEEMANGSAILYGGYDKDATYGHAFVLHGMDSEGKVYVNWGWQGQFDGYYSIDLMTPDKDTELSYWQDAIIGIRPAALSNDEYTSLWTTDEPYDLKYKSSKLTMTLKDFMSNSTIYDFKGDMRFCVIDSVTSDTTLIYKLFSNEKVESLYGWGEDTELMSKKVSFSSGHTYKAFLESKDNRESGWQRVRTEGGTFYHSIVCSQNGQVTINNKVESEGGATGIVNVTVEDTTAKYYSLDGKPLNEVRRGVNIVRMGNGKIRKVVVK